MARGTVWECLGAVSGIGAVGLIGAYSILDDPYNSMTDPNPDQSAEALAGALIANRDDAQLAVYAGLAGAFLMLWFLGYLRRQFQRAEGTDGWLTSVVYGGGLVAVGLVLLSVSFTLAESELASYGADVQVAKTFFVYGWESTSILAPPLAALVVAGTLLGFWHAALPKWLNWVSVPIVAVMVIACIFAPYFATWVGYLWIALTAIALAIRAWRGDLPTGNARTAGAANP